MRTNSGGSRCAQKDNALRLLQFVIGMHRNEAFVLDGSRVTVRGISGRRRVMGFDAVAQLVARLETLSAQLEFLSSSVPGIRARQNMCSRSLSDSLRLPGHSASEKRDFAVAFLPQCSGYGLVVNLPTASDASMMWPALRPGASRFSWSQCRPALTAQPHSEQFGSPPKKHGSMRVSRSAE